MSTFQYNFNIHVSITNSKLLPKSYDFVADVYIDGVPDGFITIPRSGTLDYQGATFFDRNFHFDLPTDLTNVSKLLFTGYFSTYRVTVDADSVTNNAVCQSGVTTEIPINQAYIGGDTANISITYYIMKFCKYLLKQVFTSHSGISSKRLCGVGVVCLLGSVNILCNKRNSSPINDRHSPVVLYGIVWHRFSNRNMEEIHQ